MDKRKTNRIKDYDYSQNGAYFITICAKNHAQIFGKIPDADAVGAVCGRPILSQTGRVVEAEIAQLSKTYDNVYVDCYVVMPNHVHMIIVIDTQGNGQPQAAPTVSRIVNQWKGAVTKKAGFSPWQKSFHDHIIRNEARYLLIAEYIQNNPAKWAQDRYYPEQAT